jgi:plasmid maintenance system antidote protein VapI
MIDTLPSDAAEAPEEETSDNEPTNKNPNLDPATETFLSMLREQMKAQNMNNQGLSHALGISAGSVSNLFNGRRRLDVKLAVHLELVFGLPTVEWLEPVIDAEKAKLRTELQAKLNRLG